MQTEGNSLERMLPHSSDIEKAVVGALLIESDAYSRVCDVLTSDCFYERKNLVVYESIKALQNDGQRTDLLLVVQKLLETNQINVAGGPEYVAELGQSVLSSAHIEQHAKILSELATRRKMIALGHEIETRGYNEGEDLQKIVSESADRLGSIVAGGRQDIYTFANVLTEIGDIMRQNAQDPDASHLTKTGFPFVDTKGGFQASDFIVIAGETSQGKTSFANSITLSVIKAEKKVAFYSMEMTKEQLTARFLSRESKVSSNRILNDVLNAEEMYRVNTARAELLKWGLNLYFDDSSTSNIDKILASIRAMKLRYDIDGAVIDYLQILNLGQRGESREQRMGEAARLLKNLAKDLKIWVVALSQLSRDRQNPEPSLDRIRDSGQIAEAADVVMLVYRPEYYGKRYGAPYEQVDTRGTAMIHVCKGRNVGVGKFICGFDAYTTSFYPMDELPRWNANNVNIQSREEKMNKNEDFYPF